MTARRAMVAVLALLLVMGGTTTGAAGPAERNQEPDWLARVNELRVGSGLHALVEDPGRSAALQEAVNYMAGTGRVGHDLPDDAGPAAQRAAASSNLTHELAGTTPTAMIDGWMTDPGHLVNVLNPGVALTGFAQATFTEQTSNAGDVVAGLWTLQAVVFPENRASLRLHRSAGFRTVGVRDRIAQLDGEWRDTVLMERRR